MNKIRGFFYSKKEKMSVCKKLLLIISITAAFAKFSFAADTSIDSAAMLAAHNQARAEVGAPNLTWSTTLQQKAEQWAVYLKNQNNCMMKYSGLGENLYWASTRKTANSKDANGKWIYSIQETKEADVVSSWLSEKQWYAYPANTCSAPQGKASCRHYTQVIWKATTEVGCGKATCADKTQMWVCNYSPAGNIVGQKPY
jgi:hypothetical protein